MTPEIKNRILSAAARVYSQHGFRGATTRLIATEAGVNEVTLFRTFGSKAELLQEMLQSHANTHAAPVIGDDISDPQTTLTEWCGTLMDYLRSHSDIVRKTIAEADERPDAACAACEGPSLAGSSLALYVERLMNAGLADRNTDLPTAVSMFMSAMFGDALYRDVMPRSFPQPAEEAASKYVATFLRAVGYRASALPVRSRPARVANSRRRSR